MNKRATHNFDGAGAPYPLWLLAADAAVYWFALFYCVLLTLFLRDGAINPVVRLAGLSVVFAVILLGLATRNHVGGKWKTILVFDILIFFFIGAWLPWKFSGIGTARGLSFLWAAIEWWKIPSNIMLMFKAAPFAFIVFWIIIIALISLMSGKGKGIAAGLIIAFIAFYTYKLARMEAGVRLPAYLLFDLGLAVALFAGLRGHLRAFSRILIIDASFIIVFLFYLGIIPIFSVNPAKQADGIKRIYPAAGNSARFPLIFLRDMFADNGYIFTAYGPTSGIVRVKIDTGHADIIHNPGIVRMLWSEPESDEFFALDWMYSDFYRIGKDDFKIRNKTGLYDGLLVTPMSYAVHQGKLYVVSTDYPAITRFDLKTMKKEAAIDFRREKTTVFRSGAWKCALDKKGGKLFVEIGPVDLRGRYRIARIGLDDFKIEKTGLMPEGGLELAIHPLSGKLIAPGFFSRNIYELNPDSLKVERTFAGPLTSRNIVIDRQRNLLYSLGYTSGELAVIDYRTGKTLKRISVGKKPSSLFLDDKTGTLYFGCGSGIFSLDLENFI